MRRWLTRGITLLLGGAFAVLFAWLMLTTAGTNREVAVISATEQQILRVEALTPANLTLPLSVEGTGLVAKSLCLYDGPFMEDGSFEEVFSVTALLLENTSDLLITEAEVTLYRDAYTLVFYVEMLPPGCSVLVPEKSRKRCVERNFTDCTGWANATDYPENPIAISESGMGAYRVKNLSDSRLEDVVVYHKNYLQEAGVFLGGKAFVTKLDVIAPGQVIDVYPNNYAKDASRIAAILTE